MAHGPSSVPSEAGQAAGLEFLEAQASSSGGARSRGERQSFLPAQIEAMDKWGVQQVGSYDYLKMIKQPTLVVNGSNDVIMPTVNSFVMQQNIPNAQPIIPTRTPITGRSFNIPSCL